MQSNPEKVEELRKSAELLAKQALETAELGIKLVRNQIDANVTANPQVSNATLNMETKAKEMFTLATHFMQELNDKWQPSEGAQSNTPTSSGSTAPKAEKINIDID